MPTISVCAPIPRQTTWLHSSSFPVIPPGRWSLSIGLALPSIAAAPLRRDGDRAADRQQHHLCRTGQREAAG